MTKKVTRKELLKKPDEFMTFTGKLIRFSTENKTAITLAFAILFIAIIAISLVNFFSAKSEMEAFTVLAEAESRYSETKKDDKEAAFAEAEKLFEPVLKNYSGKQGAKLAKMLYADICYGSGKIDRAIELYEEALDDFENYPSVRNLILSGLGHCHTQKKEYDKAVGYFEKIVSDPVPIMKEDAYVNLWGLYSVKGDEAKSMETAKKIVSDYPDSFFADMIKDKAKIDS